MLLDKLGFGDWRVRKWWGERLRRHIADIAPGGLLHEIVADALDDLPDACRKDAKVLLVGLIASSAYRRDTLRKLNYDDARLVVTFRPKGSPAWAEEVQRRNSLNKDHISYFETLMISGYAARRGGHTILMEFFAPYPRFCNAFPKILPWQTDDKDEGDATDRVYKAFQRRFHDLRKKHAGGASTTVLEAGRILFADLCKFSGLQPTGIHKRISRR